MHDLSTALNLSSHQTKTQQRYSKTLNIDSNAVLVKDVMRVIQTSVAKLKTYLTANLPSFLFLLRSENCIAFGEARKTLSTVDTTVFQRLGKHPHLWPLLVLWQS